MMRAAALVLLGVAGAGAWLLTRSGAAQAAQAQGGQAQASGSQSMGAQLAAPLDSFAQLVSDTASGIQSAMSINGMTTSAAGRAAVEGFEGFSATVYTDSAGYPTIGYGHKLLPGESFPNGISRAEADQLMAQDLASAEGAVNADVNVPLTQAQFDALVSFVYNEGATAFAQSTLLADLNSGDFSSAADQFQRWTFAGGMQLPGLVSRRAAESRMFASSEYPSGVTNA